MDSSFGHKAQFQGRSRKSVERKKKMKHKMERKNKFRDKDRVKQPKK